MKNSMKINIPIALVFSLTACGGGSSDTTSAGDTTAPVITINGSDILVVQGTNYIDAGATATDDIDPSINIITTGNVNSQIEGIYNITYSATDSAGNEAEKRSRTVTVTRQEAFDKFDGIWENNCERTLKPELQEKGINYISKRLKIYKPLGVDIRFKGYTDNNANCTDTPIFTGKVFGTLTYLGGIATSTCQGEKIDVTLGYGHIDSPTIGTSDQTELNNFSNLIDFPYFNILCENGNTLHDGKLSNVLNGSGNDTRPDEFNTSFYTLKP